ncbi:Bbp16 family capsid cement protein [Hyphomicrobium sp. DY-1]|uniref:Bbp16 family capsid cement protein n=1 Tax=Hyphomicrobium sp. DY-1 TaxID=3075650 RepID=UPI0039C2778E
MIFDKTLQFSAAQALTATAASTNSVDFGANRPVGPGEPLWLVIVSKVDPTGTTPTLQPSIEVDDNSSFSSVRTVLTGPVLAAADFPAGTIFTMPWPVNLNEEYAQVKYTLGGTTPGFTVDAFLTNQDPTTWVSFPDAI